MEQSKLFAYSIEDDLNVDLVPDHSKLFPTENLLYIYEESKEGIHLCSIQPRNNVGSHLLEILYNSEGSLKLVGSGSKRTIYCEDIYRKGKYQELLTEEDNSNDFFTLFSLFLGPGDKHLYFSELSHSFTPSDIIETPHSDSIDDILGSFEEKEYVFTFSLAKPKGSYGVDSERNVSFKFGL